MRQLVLPCFAECGTDISASAVESTIARRWPAVATVSSSCAPVERYARGAGLNTSDGCANCTPNGIKITNGIKWTCPGCEMVVHDEEDYVTYCACGEVMGDGQICSYCRAVRDRDNARLDRTVKAGEEDRHE